jgi:hypothetical protein
MRRQLVLPLGLCIALAACEGASTLPLDVDIKDSTAASGGNWAEIQLVVKSLPGVELTFANQTKSMEATRSTEQFSVPKSSLKLGKNSFVVQAKAGTLLSTKQAEKTAVWEGQPKTLLRFHGSAKGDAEELTCAGAMCGQATVKATKGGHLPIEVESAIAGTIILGGSKADVTSGQRAGFDIDLLPLIGNRKAGELTQLDIPFSIEANGAKADDVLEIGGAALSDLTARMLAQVEQGPLVFAGEKAPTDQKRDLLVVVGAPIRKLIVVGSPGMFADVDLVGVAKKADRVFSCGSESEIHYNDLDIRVLDRRTAKTVGTKKLLADRVSCPPTPAGKLTGEVREDDVKRVLAEFLSK